MKLRGSSPVVTALALLLVTVAPVAARGGSATAASRGSHSPAQKPLRFSVTNLGALSGGLDAEGYSVNTNGNVAGRSSVVVRGVPTTQAFLFRGGTLAALGMPKGAQASFGYGVNAQGQVAAAGEFHGSESPYIAGPGPRTSWVRLPVPSGTKGFSAALSINQSGEAVGLVQGMGAIRWERHAGHYTRIRLTSSQYGEAASVDNAGDIVGFIAPQSYPNQPALLWPRGAKMITLTTFGGQGARAVTVITGSSTWITAAGSAQNRKGAQLPAIWQVGRHGGQWTAGKPQALPLPHGFNAGEVTGVSAGGWAVGYAVLKTNYEAVLWRNGSVVSLNSLGGSGAGWNLTRAQSVNSRGQITGWGTHNGKVRPFLLTPK